MTVSVTSGNEIEINPAPAARPAIERGGAANARRRPALRRRLNIGRWRHQPRQPPKQPASS